MLNRNIAINNNQNIFSYNKAISNFDGNVLIDDYSGKFPSINVEAVRLDSFIERNEFEIIDLLKIDVENHEPQVLEGFVKYLPKFKPTFLIEVLNDGVAEFIYNAVREHNYLYFNIDEVNGVRQTNKIVKSDNLNYLLCNREIAFKLGLIANK